MNELIVVLDYGSQYNQLIVRRIRECGVWSELLPHDTPWSEILKRAPKGIVLSGGPKSVYSKDAPLLPEELLNSGIPVLGICYGMQLLAHTLGGKVVPGTVREYGSTKLEVVKSSTLFLGVNGSSFCWMSHGDEVALLPEGFEVLAKSELVPVAAMGNQSKLLFGVQFHPEVTHTTFGSQLLKNFLKECGCSFNWTPDAFIEETVNDIRSVVGDKRVLLALSGGVDSSVAAVLVNKAIGSQLSCIFVNNGLLRACEEEEVRSLCREADISLDVVNAEERFLSKLIGVLDPEVKRMNIGHEFIAVFEEEGAKLGSEFDFLVQGTLYPDVVESRGVNKSGALIKTHHNVGGLPENMHFSLIEPFRFLFKDEVRKVGKALGLPDSIINRQPFPGPGLAVRIVGEITKDRLDMLRQADLIVREECEKDGVSKDLWQYFAVLLPVKSVGVMGDERSYAYTVAVRTVTSQDGMTADWGRLTFDLLGKISNRIVNEVNGVNRVVYDLTSKPPGTIEWE